MEYSVPRPEGKTMFLKGGLLAPPGSFSYFKVTENTLNVCRRREDGEIEFKVLSDSSDLPIKQ